MVSAKKSNAGESSRVPPSRLTKTTAASMRGREFPSRLGGVAKSEKPPKLAHHSKQQSSVHAKTVVGKIARPRSKFDNSVEGYISKGGDVLNFPYSFDEREK